jgi:Cu-processing system permease protein
VSDAPEAGPGSQTDGDVRSNDRTAAATTPRPPAWRQVAVIAGQAYRLSLRNRWAYALTALFGLMSVLLMVFGGSSLGPARVDAIVISLAQLGTYLVPLAALVFGYDSVVGAESEGWLEVLYALPVERGWVVVGTYLGRAAALAGATLIGLGLGGVVLVATAGLVRVGLFLVVLFGAVGLGLAFLSVSVLVSTLARAKTHALGGVLLVWVWFVFVHDLVALGAIAAVDLPDPVLSAVVLANPADVFRVLVVGHVDASGGGIAAVFTGTGLSAPILVLALVGWCVVPTVAATRLVARRSL